MTYSGSNLAELDPDERAFRWSLGTVLRRYRKRRHVSQQRLGDTAGNERQSVNRHETAATGCSLAQFVAYATALDVEPGTLLTEVLEYRRIRYPHGARVDGTPYPPVAQVVSESA